MEKAKEKITEIKEKYGHFSGEQIKLIALIFMVIDHIGYRFINSNATCDIACYRNLGEFFRILGRISFPIFAFCVVEGFRHTSNTKKYAIRLLIAAIISEIPFDMMCYYDTKAFNGKYAWFVLADQNVMITFLLAIIMLSVIEEYKLRKTSYYAYYEYVIVIVTCIVAYVVKCDYIYYGIILMWMYYKFADDVKLCVIIMVVVFTLVGTPTAALSVIPIYLLYNGKRTNKLVDRKTALIHKYFFYAFYPVHLLLVAFL